MVDEEKVIIEEQVLVDEWVVVLVEVGDVSQDDIDVLMVQGGVIFVVELSILWVLMEEFGVLLKVLIIFGLEGFNLDVILDILVIIFMEVGYIDISICNLLQFNQGLVIEFDCLVGELLDVLVNGILIVYGEVVVVNEKFGICLIDVISFSECIKKLC